MTGVAVLRGYCIFQVGCGLNVGTARHLKWGILRPRCFLTVNAETIDNNYVAEPTENFYDWSSITLAKQEDNVSSTNKLAGKSLAAPPTDVPSVRAFSRIQDIVSLHRLFPQYNQERLSVDSFIVFEKNHCHFRVSSSWGWAPVQLSLAQKKHPCGDVSRKRTISKHRLVQMTCSRSRRTASEQDLF